MEARITDSLNELSCPKMTCSAEMPSSICLLIQDPKRCNHKYEIVTNFTALANLYKSKDFYLYFYLSLTIMSEDTLLNGIILRVLKDK